MLEKYRFTLSVTVRFADLDAMGHLNNVTYLTYVEQARIIYVRDVCGWQTDWRKLGMILARTEIDYKLPIGFEHQVMVYMRMSRIGGKSFDFDYIITRQKGDNAPEIAAEVKTVMVAYDYETDNTISVPQSWRDNIIAYEPDLQ
ncbi:MAG: acyl-CoA thioesterase [Anaerolineae bacterium]|nr:acyl-CoA thioesterase [Anaerolineae bacterium]